MTMAGNGSCIPKTQIKIRQHLDSGILSTLVKKYIAMDKTHPSLREPKYSLTTPSYKLAIIGALAMQLGCHLSEEFRAWLGENYRKVGELDE